MIKIELNEIKRLELDILAKFANFCDKRELNYSLAYGTLLGCVRHRGFIPWDDDIDVFMPRFDYEKLLGMKKDFENYYPGIVFKYIGDAGYPFSFLKITDDNTRVEETDLELKYQYGVWIDVFPLDRISPNTRRHEQTRASIDFWNKILVKSIIIKSKNIGPTRFLKKMNYFLLIPSAHLIQWFIDIPALCNKKSKQFYLENTNLVANYVWEKNRRKPVFDLNKIFPVKKGIFEGLEFNIPNDADYILKKLYDDYMQLPSESERISHLTNAWRIK